jgi:hypothetical protein
MNAVFLFDFIESLEQGSRTAHMQPAELEEKVLQLFLMEVQQSLSRQEYAGIKPNDTIQGLSKLVIHHLLNHDSMSARHVLEIIQATDSLETEWKQQYLSLLSFSQERLCQNISIEKFESMLEDIPWTELPDDILDYSLILTGFVYLQEGHSVNRKKCKHWLDRLTQKADASTMRLMALSLLLEYHLTLPEPGSSQHLEKIYHEIDAYSPQKPEEKNLIYITRFKYRIKEVIDFPEQAPSFILKANGDITDPDRLSSINRFCLFFTLFTDIHPLFFKVDQSKRVLYAEALMKINEEFTQKAFNSESNKSLKYRMMAINIPLMVYIGKPKLALEQAQELFNLLKEEKCWRTIVQLSEFLYQALAHAELSHQVTKLLLHNFQDLIHKNTTPKWESGVYILQLTGWIYQHELSKPGVSSFIQHLPDLVKVHEQFMTKLENDLDELGLSGFGKYQEAFTLLCQISKYHVKTALQIHLLEIRLLGLACKIRQDSAGHALAQNMLKALKNPINPLSFIQGNWEDFKDVPNDIRNKILNHSITIFKGDLPAAADHLPFSYRNMRSYISLNEVNRLGNFLYERSSGNRSLEEGIRLMFHDLYLKGHIFEVLFDFPAYLVQRSGTGFTTLELEEYMKVKPSTAKKYIRILTDHGMLESFKPESKKVTYRIHVENLMRRYAAEKSKHL